MYVPRLRGCLYPTCTAAIVRSHVYTADHEQDWHSYAVDLYFANVMAMHTYIH